MTINPLIHTRKPMKSYTNNQLINIINRSFNCYSDKKLLICSHHNIELGDFGFEIYTLHDKNQLTNECFEKNFFDIVIVWDFFDSPTPLNKIKKYLKITNNFLKNEGKLIINIYPDNKKKWLIFFNYGSLQKKIVKLINQLKLSIFSIEKYQYTVYIKNGALLNIPEQAKFYIIDTTK